MEKPKLDLISKTKIVKSEGLMEDFEWYFIDIKQLQQRVEWLKLKTHNTIVMNNRSLTRLEFFDLIDEAFEEVKSQRKSI